jgi:hypothetical protein
VETWWISWSFWKFVVRRRKIYFLKKTLQNGEYLPQKNGSWTMKNFWYTLVFINHTWPNKNLLHVIINFFNHQWKLRYINCLQHSCYNKKKRKLIKKFPIYFCQKKKSSRKKIGGNMERKILWYHFLQMTMCFIETISSNNRSAHLKCPFKFEYVNVDVCLPTCLFVKLHGCLKYSAYTN